MPARAQTRRYAGARLCTCCEKRVKSRTVSLFFGALAGMSAAPTPEAKRAKAAFCFVLPKHALDDEVRLPDALKFLWAAYVPVR